MTGFRGRLGIYEILLVSDEIKKLIAQGNDLTKLRGQGIREGMKALRLSGAMKVAQGLTTIEEILKVAPPVEV
jgi:general secretion pathway protein E